MKESREYSRRTGDNSIAGRPLRDTAEDKRKISDYSGIAVKRFKADEEEFNCIFTMPQDKIFAKLKKRKHLQET